MLKGSQVSHADISIAFLNTDIDILLQASRGEVVYQLQMTLYGLKQSLQL